jgi:ribosomal protein L21E
VAVPELSAWLDEIKLMTEVVQQHLIRSKQHMKRQTDKGRFERQFQVGDLVFLKLQPYVQTSVVAHCWHSLA